MTLAGYSNPDISGPGLGRYGVQPLKNSTLTGLDALADDHEV